MGLWYPMATRAAAPNDGGSMLGGPSRIVWHTTEGTSAAGAIAAMRAADSWAHFTATYEHGHLEVYQHIPLDRAARALRHPAGTVDTNRMGTYCAQVEVVGFAAKAPGLPASYLAALADFARNLESVTGTPRRCGVTFKAYPDSYGASNGVRLSEAAWRAYSGHLGHQHVPGNLHGDPGALDIAAILRVDTPQPLKEDDIVMDDAAKKEIRQIVREELVRAVQFVGGRTNTVYNTGNHDLDGVLTLKDVAPAPEAPAPQ
jgi:hypothetical protein